MKKIILVLTIGAFAVGLNALAGDACCSKDKATVAKAEKAGCADKDKAACATKTASACSSKAKSACPVKAGCGAKGELAKADGAKKPLLSPKAAGEVAANK